jgi:hypothetical protein
MQIDGKSCGMYVVYHRFPAISFCLAAVEERYKRRGDEIFSSTVHFPVQYKSTEDHFIQFYE